MTSCLQVCNLPLLMSPKEIPTGSSHQSPSVRASASHCQSCALHSPRASSSNYHCSGWREERNREKPSVKYCGKLRNELMCRSKTSWWWPSKSLQLQDKQHQYPLSSPNTLAAHWKELVLPLAGKDTQFSESCLFRGLRPWRWWLGRESLALQALLCVLEGTGLVAPFQSSGSSPEKGFVSPGAEITL